MNNIFARLFCSKNHSTSDEAYNIVESMAKAKPLYKELIKQAHPDKHPNNKDVAEELNRNYIRFVLRQETLFHEKTIKPQVRRKRECGYSRRRSRPPPPQARRGGGRGRTRRTR